ncbi:MAG: hypothetical protein R3E79_58275 [Caldilineaceae bacterium]
MLLLRQYLADFNAQHDVYVTLQLEFAARASALRRTGITDLRMIQEALNNVSRHAQASLAWVKLALDGDSVIRLTIRDNGKGFDVASLNRLIRAAILGCSKAKGGRRSTDADRLARAGHGDSN